jgi:hypothetical protein
MSIRSVWLIVWLAFYDIIDFFFTQLSIKRVRREREGEGGF